jgi:ferrochelatase
MDTDEAIPTIVVVSDYDAVILVSFGGPEGPDDVVPFLENVTAGRGIPRERLAIVGAHYEHFGGVSPLNEQCRRLQAALQQALEAAGRPLPVYWGNRNWNPYLRDSVAEMAAAGVQRALAIVTSAYSSYSGCRQYLDDIEAARAAVGPSAPTIEKIRTYFDQPGFIEPYRDRVREALARGNQGSDETALVFTAHSIPTALAATCAYEEQLRAAASLVAEAAPGVPWELVWQSRSGPPSVPWLEPDVNDHLHDLAAAGRTNAVVVPIGFVSDHVEVLWDLHQEARGTAAELGIGFDVVQSPGTEPDPRFVDMLVALVAERTDDATPVSLGPLRAPAMPCAAGCCPPPIRS